MPATPVMPQVRAAEPVIDARRDRRIAWPTALISVLLVTAAASGLFLGPYTGETEFARNGYRGADLVSLVLAVPALACGAWSSRRGSTRGLLLWLGVLGYVAYQYGYTFAYGWNRLFLVYLALLSVSAFTLVGALASLDLRAVVGRFDPHTPTRPVALFLTVIAVGLGVIELGQIVPTFFSGDVPKIVADTRHPTSPVFILDLGLVVPLMLLTAAWLRRGRGWGYVAAPILLVKGVTVGLGLLAANLFAAAGGDVTDGPLNGLWAVISLGSAVLLWRFLRHVD